MDVSFRYNDMEMRMGRRPIGDHAMTSAERQRRFLARLANSRAAAPAPNAGELIIKVDHLRRFPAQTVSWLCQRLGKRNAVVIRNEFNRAIAALPEETDRDESEDG